MWAVVTIPEREPWADDLIRQLHRPALKVLDTIYDANQNHIRAWTQVCEFASEWVGVLQDDAVLCKEFERKTLSRLEEADALGYRAVSLYNANRTEANLLRVHARWVQVDIERAVGVESDVPGVEPIPSVVPAELCMLIRRDVAVHYPKFARSHPELYRAFPGSHDALLGLFLSSRIGGTRDLARARRINPVYIAFPNLVDHRDIPSSLGNPARRFSTTFTPEAD